MSQKQTKSVYVTETNQAWASKVTGLSRDEVAKQYREAAECGVVCVIMVDEVRTHG